MPLEITVGSPQLLVHQGLTFWVSEPDGQMLATDRKGLFFRDTRLICHWQLYANDVPFELMNGGATTHFSGRVFLANRLIPTISGDIAPRTLSLVLSRWISGGIHEDLDVTNHGMLPARFNLELAIRSDFADLFEVKTGRVVRRGRIDSEWSHLAQTLRTEYVNGDFRRGVTLKIHAVTPVVYANGRITFDIDLAPGASWHACLLYEVIDGTEVHAPPQGCIAEAGRSPAAESLAAWQAAATKLSVPNHILAEQYGQAVADIAALRMPIVQGGREWVLPAAGLPWFLAPFGRDSLIVSLQTLPVTHEFARGALAVLGALQATGRDEARDAEPGKILHELRLGELAHFKLIPHTPYFGTADATPLYVILLHAAWRWTGDDGLLDAHMATAERCLEWIDAEGDRDGDGFQEYQTRAALGGYENMGWKDAGDAVLYPDGTLVRGPKALCELQGYVYAAWRGMAELYAVRGEPAKAAALNARAAALFNRFNDAFWDEATGFYAFALDGEKRRVMSVASNVGQCLWAGIVRPDRARRVVERLMAPDMFSGWGIRTLSANHVAFNPYSYHDGSIWPHDNGLIALGFARYGFHAEAAQLARAVSEAAGYFAQHQVPELYAGIPREEAGFPVQCLGANVPQAWAAGSAFSFLTALCGFTPDGAAGTLGLDPHLPDWAPALTLRDLSVGELELAVRVERDRIMPVDDADGVLRHVKRRWDAPGCV